MSNSDKTDEIIIMNIVKENVNITNDDDELDLIIYYISTKTAELVTRNNMKKRNMLNSTNVIYKYNCHHKDCMLQNINYNHLWYNYNFQPTIYNAPE